MDKMTITEALAEIKLILKKIDKLQKVVNSNLFRYEHSKDPFESDGGSRMFAEASLQSIKNLYQRLSKIRAAITKANLENSLTIGDTTLSLHEWLTYKREIAKPTIAYYLELQNSLKQKMDEHDKRPQVYKDEATGKIEIAKLHASLDYAKIVAENQKLSDIEQTLDGKLSLKNATIVIEV